MFLRISVFPTTCYARARELLLLLIFPLLSALPAGAAQERRTFDVPAGEAVETLRLMARQGGVEIVFLVETVRGIRTAAVRGSFTLPDALNRLIAGTPLIVTTDAQTGGLVVSRPPSPPPSLPKNSNPQPRSMTAKSTFPLLAAFLSVFAAPADAQTGTPAKDEVITLSPFTIDTGRDDTFGAKQATTGSLVALDIAKSPFTIMAIDNRMIEDLQLFDYEDIARYTTVNTTSGANETANARGFNLQALRNGYAPGGRVYITAGYDRVEVLKGPNSVLYGLSNPGGGINYISKRPTFKRATKLSVTTGSHSLLQGMFDTTAPIEIGGKKLLAYRLVVAGSDGDGQFPDQFTRYDLLAPSLTIRPFQGLELTAEYEKLHKNQTMLNSAPVVNNQYDLSNLGRGRNINFAGADSVMRNTQNAYNLSGTYSHQDWLTLRAQYNSSKRENPVVNTWNQDAANQRPQFNDGSNKVHGYSADALIRYGLKDRVKGSLLLGTEFNSNYFITPQYRFTNANVANALLFPSGIANATPDQLRFRNTADAARGYPIATIDEIKQPAYFRANGGDTTSEFTNQRVFNTLKFFDERLTLLGGYSWAEVTSIGAAPTRIVQSQKDKPYQLAVMVEVLENKGPFDYLRAYAQKATSFRNQFARDAYLNPVPPNHGRITEFGLKFGLFKNRLTGSVAYFDQLQSDLAQAVPAQAVDNPATPADERQTGISIASGRESSEGVEFRLDFEATSRWTIALEGCFFHGGVVEDEVNPARKGLPLSNAPTRTIVFLQRYSFGESLKGLTVGHSIHYKNEYSIANSSVVNSLRVVPSATLVDVFAKYNTKLWGRPVDFNFKVSNVFDRNYLLSAGRWGQPVGWVFSMSTKF